MLIIATVLLVVAVPLLGLSADMFVDAASRISHRYRLAPVFVGVVLLGFGTSLPEALASIIAALDGQLDVAAGNVIGSNVANLTLVLGGASLLCVTTFPASTLRKELVLMLSASLLLAGLLWDGYISRADGLILILGMAVSLCILAYSSRAKKTPRSDIEVYAPDTNEVSEGKAGILWVKLVCGLVGTVIGAYLLVRAALEIAQRFGLTGGLVGVSLVALGTSLPEMVTSYHAARRNEGELIVGNILGSNIFNVFLVAGAAGLVGPGRVEGALAGSATWLMLVVSMAVGLLAWRFRRIPRFAVPFLIGGYVFVLLVTA